MKEIVLGLVSLATLSAGLGAKQRDVTYFSTIKPMVESKCLPCHSKAVGYAPFDFSTYEGVTSRIELIRNQVLAKNMPPVWAHSDYGQFAQVEQVTDEEAVHLQEWIRLKMPKGEPQSQGSFEITRPIIDPVKTVRFAKGSTTRVEGVPYWSVLSQDLPAKGGRFDSFWLKADNPRVIRNVTLAIVPKGMKVPSETVGSMDLPAKYLVGTWAIGYPTWALPIGISRSYPPNSKLVVQVHYRPTGKPENAGFQVSMMSSGQVVTKEPSWITLEKKDLEIPAGKSIVTELTYTLTKDMKVLSLLPEARFYAARIELLYTPKDGKSKTLYDNMRWDPYWIGNYTFTKPVTLPKGGTLTARFHFDNDEFCRINEGKKPKPVKTGPTASDEICRFHLLVGS
jgi:hypothetical protein